MNSTKGLIILGRLGSNPELKYTKKKEAVCTFSIAENIRESEKTIWHKIVVWGKQAELCSACLKKGSQLFVQGRKSLREYETSNGDKKQIEEVVCTTIGFVEEEPWPKISTH